MSTFLRPGRHLHFLLAALIVAGLAWLFWTGSRYPALDEKAMMSGAIQLEDSLSFEAKFAIPDGAGAAERIFWSTLNWINTNKKGMTFGVLFAAAFLTAASYLARLSFRGGLANAALGLVIGTPLGVCVNCAAPIAKGMYSAGLRAETTLAAMIASPTLNIVVLTMTFSILPVYMGLAKIGLSLLVILVAVPLIARALPRREIAREIAPPGAPAATGWSAAELAAGTAATTPGILSTITDVARNFLKNLWFIIRLTVPLMFLAGLLGAIVATYLPQDAILGLPFSLLALLAVAAVGVFLPVPIAFDVVMAGALLGLGLSHGYVMALLFTLGSFSVYSFLIVAGSVGPRAAWMLAATVALLGALGGAGAEYYHRWQSDRALELLLGASDPAFHAPAFHAPAFHAPGAHPAFAALAQDSALPVITPDAAHVTVTATPLAPPSRAGAALFTRSEAITRGIDKPIEFSFRDMWPPFWEGRSLSSGDIDRDGDTDLVIASTGRGLYFYLNDGAGGFTATGDAGPFADMHVFNAALVDIDNDGWRDLVIATYRGGLWLWRSVEGRFGPAPPTRLPNRADAPLAMALAFADVTGNAYPDIAVGNWAAGWYRRIPGEESRNRLLFNAGGRITGQADLPGIPGETLSILFADVNDDSHDDLIVGNDFDIPDYVYLGDGAGGFTMIEEPQGLIPHTTTTTMAVKVADLVPGGRPEIYLAQIAGRSSGVSETLKMQPLDRYCAGIETDSARETCEANMAIKRWYRSGNSFDPTYARNCLDLPEGPQAECRAMLVKDLAIQRRDPSVCALIPAGQPVARAYCDLHFLPTRQPTAEEIAVTHRQILRSNVLLEWQGAAWDDTAQARGLDVGGWSWDTKLRDFDLDGDLDVYIVNGTWVPNEVSPSNLYFVNDGAGNFTESSGPAGLEDYLMTASATAFDADGDGDLDMLTHPVNGPLTFFENTAQAPRIVVRLSDRRGPRDGLGAVLRLVDDAGGVQRRQIVSGGGFMSFDAPLAVFGLAPGREAAELVITWADGGETRLGGPIAPGRGYLVTRGQ